MPRPIWKCPCIKLFITYFRHLEKRHPYWPETKSRPIWKWSCSNPITGYYPGVWKYGQFFFRSYWSYKNAFIWTKHVINMHIISSIGKKNWIQTFYNKSLFQFITPDKTLAIRWSLHLIWFIIRMYSCNINSHFVDLGFVFYTLLINVTVLW
jgi:hypothetical protein